MEQIQNSCCSNIETKPKGGFLSGILYGLLPHSFCIAFTLFSIIGAVTATTFLKKFLLIPNFFYFLVLVSLLLATISSAIYLKRAKCLCASGVRTKWKYITTLYATTVLVNLMMFFVVIPAVANINTQNASANESNLSQLSIDVQIPCSGHASLIMDEIRKNYEVQSIKFELPNNFKIEYDPKKTSPEKIVALDIFKTYGATIN